jgi:formylglycine-generating enzyme required for sulfatase activity
MDKYLVTVGRFRQFVTAWSGGAGYAPPAGSGKHTHLNGGSGLSATGGGYEPGWIATDDSNIAPTNTNLACDPNYATWTASVGSNENLPISCVNWYESYAFCIWDGGFLPSEAEWEYVAAGGSEQREYPWGTTDPGAGNQYAIYNSEGITTLAPVGAATLGAGLWGQLDMAGETCEWNLDWYAMYVDPCNDCANVTASTSSRVYRGCDFDFEDYGIFPFPDRLGGSPAYRQWALGLRCSRTP